MSKKQDRELEFLVTFFNEYFPGLEAGYGEVSGVPTVRVVVLASTAVVLFCHKRKRWTMEALFLLDPPTQDTNTAELNSLSDVISWAAKDVLWVLENWAADEGIATAWPDVSTELKRLAGEFWSTMLKVFLPSIAPQ